MKHILIWVIGDQQYAISLSYVDSVLLACSLTHFPYAPSYINGMINVHGKIVPVFNVRQLLGLPEKELEIEDQFILVKIHEKLIALLVDKVKDVKSCSPEDLIPTTDILNESKVIEHVLKEKDQIILLYDLEKMIPDFTLPELT